MRQTYREYMQEAIKLATTSTMEMKHGCVIVNVRAKDGKPIVARGVNQHVLNLEDRRVFSRHAEMSAVASLIAIKGHNSSFFDKCVAFVARVGPSSTGNDVRMSKPCADCQRLLKKMGISKVYYTYDSRTVCCLSDM
jgi:tRNA(Arg) A34 adenosine deaminase TadA